jgi:tRNA (guanosine-2'-O-)-methyltransferase
VATNRRREKIISVLSKRQPDLRVVLEDVIIAHNASAVSRTCEAVGVLNLHIISPEPEKVVFNEAISTRAEKWLNIQFHRNTAECLTSLKNQGYKIAVTTLSAQAVPYHEINYCQPIAIVFGNEAEGVSEEAIKLADFCIHIPMVGMVQSLNLSVSVGIILYEAYRQRYEKGFYSAPRLSQEEFDRWLKLWLSNPKNRKPFTQEK